MSLSSLTEQLQRLQRLFAQPWSSAGSGSLFDEAPAFRMAASQARQAGIAGSAVERAAALRALSDFSACVPHLAASMLAIPDQKQLVSRVAAFTFVVPGSLILAIQAGLASELLARLAGQLAQLLLRCGTESLTRRPPLRPDVATSLLSGLFHGLIPPFSTAREATDDNSQAIFLAFASPSLVATFLRASVAACCAIPAQMQGPGSQYASDMTLLSKLLATLVPIYNTPELRPHLLDDAQLLLPLVALLIPGVAASAVSLQLPPERRPEGSSWFGAVGSAAVVSALDIAIPGQLAAQVARGSGRTAQLLPAFARLLLHVPLPARAVEDGPHGEQTSWRDIESLAESLVLAAQVEYHALELSSANSRSAGASRQPSHTTLLLQLIPRFANIFQLLDADAKEGMFEANLVAAALSSCTQSVACLAVLLERVLLQPEGGLGALPPAECVLTLSGAGVGTMRLLAWLAAAGNAIPLGQRAAHAQATTAASQCGKLAVIIAVKLASRADRLPRAGHIAQELRNMLQSLWAMHTAGCRLMHCTPELEPNPVMFLPVTLYATYGIVAAAGEACQRLYYRQLQAMTCAHLEALRACLPALVDIRGTGGNNAIQQNGVALALSLGLVAAWGPASVATGPELHTLFAQLADLFPPASLPKASLYSVVCQEAQRSAPVAALLLAGGLLGGPVRAEPTVQAMQAVVQQELQLAINTVDPALLVAADEAAAAGRLPTATASERQLASEVRQAAAVAREALITGRRAQDVEAKSACLAECVLPAAQRLADALLAWWRRPEQQAEAALEAAQAAAERSCAYLRCANLAAEGGPAAGQGEGSMRCSACRAVWYCGTACSHADWREGGHRRLCKALGAARQAAKQQAAEAAGAQQGGPQ